MKARKVSFSWLFSKLEAGKLFKVNKAHEYALYLLLLVTIRNKKSSLVQWRDQSYLL